jgi:Co/Zn/Cd efflux system component
MEKRIFGVILTILGIAGLIVAAMKVLQTNTSNYAIKEMLVYGILGLVFFFAGIVLIRDTKDSAT